MVYFDKDFVQFFSELEENNHKEWFDENRKRYEKIIKDPFKQFVSDLIREISADDPTIRLEPKDAIFRINRDIRFSKDKTPYKTHVSAIVAPGGRKNKTTPGAYVELSHQHVRFYSGVYMCEKAQLLNIREEIAYNLEEFQSIVNDKNFVKTFGEVRGEKNKIIPKDFKEVAIKEPLIANKQFYFFKEFSTDLITSDQLMTTLMETYHAAKPLMFFLRKPLEE